MLVSVAPEVATPVGGGSVLDGAPPATRSTIALMAAICVPAFCAKSAPYQPIQSQQPLGLASEPLAAVGRAVLSTRVCGNSTTMSLVSAQRV